MKIAVIGAGHVGGALAKQFAKTGHRVYLGVRNIKDPKVLALLSKNISAHKIIEAVDKADVIVTAAYPQYTKEVAKQFGNVSKKIIIDAMNTFRGKPNPYKTTTQTLFSYTPYNNT